MNIGNELKIMHIWSVICTNSSIDQVTNNISLYNVLEQITVKKEAFDKYMEKTDREVVVNINFEVISFWKKKIKNENISAEQQIEIIDPQGKILGTQKYPLQIPANVQRMRFRLQINGFKITIPGDYTFQISVRDSKKNDFAQVASLPLLLVVAENC